MLTKLYGPDMWRWFFILVVTTTAVRCVEDNVGGVVAFIFLWALKTIRLTFLPIHESVVVISYH